MNCEELKSSVLHWIGQEVECQPSGDGCLIATLPIFKPNGDYIEIGIEPAGNDKWKLSDLGDTHSTLFLAGVNLADEDAPARADEFQQLIEAHQIHDVEQELSVETSSDELVGRMFDFTHAIQSMLALQLTIQVKYKQRNFPKIVADFLSRQHVSYEASPRVEGRSGRWKFDFRLNGVHTPTLIKALSTTSKRIALREAELTVFQVTDVKKMSPQLDALVITDDDETERQVFSRKEVSRVFGMNDVSAYAFNGNRDELVSAVKKYAV